MRTERCRSCGSTLLEPVLDLGPQPASDHFPLLSDPLPDPTWPLSLVLCPSCGLAQLGGTTGPLPEPPLAVESTTMRSHADSTARRIARLLGLGPGASVAEFRSHHGGSWLPTLESLGLRQSRSGPADLVLDVHGLAHDEDVAVAVEQRVAAMAEGGRLVAEFHHLLPLVEECQFDTVRHGHPVYLSLTSVANALAPHGLRVLRAVAEPVFGGSLLVVAGRNGEVDVSVLDVRQREHGAGLSRPERLRSLQRCAAAAGEALRDWLRAAAAEGRRVVGYGAPSKAAGLLTWSGIGPDLLPFTADLSPAKQGRRIPGAGIPIVSPAELVAARADEVLLLAWDLADEIRGQLPEVEESGGRWVLPLPRPRYLTG